MSTTITFDKVVRVVAIILVVLFIIKAIDYLSVVLLPFFVAWFVAYLIFPVVTFFQYKLRLRFRWLAIVATMLVVVGVISLLVWLVVPPIIEDFNRFVGIVNNYITSTHKTEVELYIAELFSRYDISTLFSEGRVLDYLRQMMPGVWRVMQQTVLVIVSVVSWSVSVLYFFFILYDFERLSRGWYKLIPGRYHWFARALFTDLKRGMNAYFRGQFLIAVCVGILFCIGFTIIDFPLAIPMGILIGVLSFIPYLHALGLLPAFLLCMLKAAETGQNFWLVLLSAAAVFIIVQIIQDGVLTPKIMGNAIGLPPYLILLSLSVWGYLLGIIGMIIALPVTTILFAYYKRYISKVE